MVLKVPKDAKNPLVAVRAMMQALQDDPTLILDTDVLKKTIPQVSKILREDYTLWRMDSQRIPSLIILAQALALITLGADYYRRMFTHAEGAPGKEDLDNYVRSAFEKSMKGDD